MSVKTIAVMGPTGSGKSTFINSFVPPGSSSVIQIGHSLQSETSRVQPIELDNGNGIRFKLVDTPGFDDSREGITDIDVLSMIATFLVQEEKRSMLAGLIYMHRISDTRMGGTARQNLRMFHKICGQDSLKNVVIVTTMWDKVSPEDGKRREEELRSSETLFKPLLDEGAAMYRHDGTPASASAIIDHLLCTQERMTTQIVHELLYQQRTLEETTAGAEIQSELRAILQKHTAEIRGLEEELKSATTALTKDEIALQKRDLELSTNKLKQQLEDLKRRSGTSDQYFLPTRSSSANFGHHHPRGNEVYAPHDFRGCPCYWNDPMWGRPLPPAVAPLLVSQADYITNCTQLLHLADRIPSIRKMMPTRDDIVNYTSTWTLSFASIIGNSVDNAQHGIDSLGQLRNPRHLQNFASHFADTTKDTERSWRDTHITMAKKCGEYRAALLAEQRTVLTMLVPGGRKYFSVLQAIVGVMKLVLAEMNCTIEWWTSISDRVRTWGDVTRQPISGHGFNDFVRSDLSSVIRALESYCGAYRNLSQELRGSIQSIEKDQSYCEVDEMQAASLPTTNHPVMATSSHSKLRRHYSPRSRPSLPVGRKELLTTSDSSLTL